MNPKLSSFYPVICTNRVAETSDFYVRNFEVDDVDAEYRRLVGENGLEPKLELRSERPASTQRERSPRSDGGRRLDGAQRAGAAA